MNLTKKQKVALAALIEDEDTPQLFSPVVFELWRQCRRRSLIWMIPLLACSEEHQRFPLFYEEWVSKYLDEDFYGHFRMLRETFQNLLSEVEVTMLDKSYTGAKGDTLISTAERFDVAISKAWDCINAALTAINNLTQKMIKWPTGDECVLISTRIEERYSFPGIIGVIDCTHIECTVPKEQHASYQDRKLKHSITVQGVVTDERLFCDISVGYPGSIHDARILKESSLGRALYGGQRHVINKEFHLIGDAAYPCKTWLLTPYRDTGRLTNHQKRYNRRLSGIRVVVEQVFGLLKGRWRICRFVNVYSIEKVVDIVAACCVLHNFCLLRHDDYQAEAELEEDNDNVQEAGEIDRQGFQKRDMICSNLR